MSLADWERNGWLRSHTSSRQEIQDLLAIADRDLEDAQKGEISNDWRFGIAYNAALKLCTILLHATGFRPAHESAHYRTLASLPFILGETKKDDADYLETCRRKRNVVEYDRVGAVANSDVHELVQFVQELREETSRWLSCHHPEFM